LDIADPRPVRFIAMYDRKFKPKIFTDITMPAKLFVDQILASYSQNQDQLFNVKIEVMIWVTNLQFCEKHD